VTFKPNKTSIKTCRKKGLSTAAIKLRLVRVDLPGEVEVLIKIPGASPLATARLSHFSRKRGIQPELYSSIFSPQGAGNKTPRDLIDSTTYEARLFKSLYHLRWGIEENYKRLKQWVEVENFSGKSALSVKQDFYAKIVAMNLTAIISIAAQKKSDNKTQQRDFRYQINFAQALSKMKHTIIKLVTQSGADFTALIRKSINYISKTIEPVREG